MRLQAKWGIITNPMAISKDNSGSTLIENISKEELANKIDGKIKDAGRYYYKSDKNKTILRKFSQLTYKAYKIEPIEKNDAEYSDEELKILLRDYDKEFKKPLKQMLIEYYRLEHNPEIRIEETLLENLGFKPCGQCYNKSIGLQFTL